MENGNLYIIKTLDLESTFCEELERVQRLLQDVSVILSFIYVSDKLIYVQKL